LFIATLFAVKTSALLRDALSCCFQSNIRARHFVCFSKSRVAVVLVAASLQVPISACAVSLLLLDLCITTYEISNVLQTRNEVLEKLPWGRQAIIRARVSCLRAFAINRFSLLKFHRTVHAAGSEVAECCLCCVLCCLNTEV